MKAFNFVQFGCETSNTKSSSHAKFKTWLKWYLTGLFSFYWPILSQDFDRKLQRKHAKKNAV